MFSPQTSTPSRSSHVTHGRGRLRASLLLLPLSAAGCFGLGPDSDGPVEEPFTEECVPSDWLLDAEQNPESGVLTSLSLVGSQVRIEGEEEPLVETIEAPLAVADWGGGSPLLVFEDAVVEGSARGTLVLHGAYTIATSGRFRLDATATVAIDDDMAWVDPTLPEDHAGRPDLGASAPEGHQAALDESVPTGLRAEDLVFADYDGAYLVTDEETLELVGSFRVSAEDLYWSTDASLVSESITARWTGDVFIGIGAHAGEARTSDGPLSELPVAILGRDAHVEIGPRLLRTLEDLPVWVLLGEDGNLLESDVELRACEPQTLVMEEGSVRSLRFARRQRGNTADAILVGATIVNVDDGSVWGSLLEIDPSVPMDLVDVGERYPWASWAQTLDDVVNGIVDGAGGLGQALGCIFTLGLACSTEVAPYPMWMDAGDVQEFEVEITAPSAPGTYEIEVRLEGDNYEAMVPFTVIVPVPED